jgi:squalene synthase HpnC
MSSAPPASPEARRAAAAVTRAHDENFPVAVGLLPAHARDDMRAVYAFCRATDDIGDEPGVSPGERLRRLDAWADDLEAAIGGGGSDPRLRAVGATIAHRRLDPDLFRRLVEANRMDQRRSRWDTMENLLRYCEHSATPVGRMVLGVLGYRDGWRAAYSDRTCIGLQLVNFWQDIRRDLDERDRIYLPAADMARLGVREADLSRARATPALRDLVALETGRARAHLEAGAPLARLVDRRTGLALRMFTAGGLALCDAIARQDHDTLRSRPSPGRLGRARIALGVLARLGGGHP